MIPAERPSLEIPPQRRIVRAEALAWLDENPSAKGASVITSVPDLSEARGVEATASDAGRLRAWQDWCVIATRRVVRWLPAAGVAIFFQSDLRIAGTWIDKGYLTLRAIDDEGASLVWHKIVCRLPAGAETFGRASYAHMICAARSPRPAPRHATADVLPDGGPKSWSKAMGENACRLACRYLRDETETTLVVDPFCGNGTALAVANALGFHALGVDMSARRCRAARRLVATTS